MKAINSFFYLIISTVVNKKIQLAFQNVKIIVGILYVKKSLYYIYQIPTILNNLTEMTQWFTQFITFL